MECLGNWGYRMISRYFDVVRATDTPDNYLSVGYDVDVIEYKHETIKSDKPSKLVSLEKGDILVGTVKQQVALFVGDFEAYAQQGWKVLRLKDGVDIDVIGVFAFMNTQRFNYLLRGAYRGESASNLIIGEFTGIELEIKYINPSVTKDFMLQIKLRKLVERRTFLIKELKKGMMQRMFVQKVTKLKDKIFNKNWSDIPELRFPGYTDAWVKCELSKLAKFSKGRGFSKSDLVNTGYPIILYGRLYTNYETTISVVTDTFISDDLNSIKSEIGDVIVPGSGETAEDISRASNVDISGIVLGGDLNIIKPNNQILDSTFLAITISNGSQQKELTKRAQGKSVVHLHNSDLEKILVYLPTKGEQIKIGKFFTKLDQAIAVNERELNKLKELKKCYLQKSLCRKERHCTI